MEWSAFIRKIGTGGKGLETPIPRELDDDVVDPPSKGLINFRYLDARIWAYAAGAAAKHQTTGQRSC